MGNIKFEYSDGGRSKYFKAANVDDCVVRAICNASGKDYKDVYDSINDLAKCERKSKRKRGISSSRNGVYKGTQIKYIEGILGWKWHACSGIGTGCTTHLNEDELPNGTLIVKVSKHLTCVKDGVLYDTYDCSRDGTRCVYGYWKKDEQPKVRKLNKDEICYRVGQTLKYGIHDVTVTAITIIDGRICLAIKPLDNYGFPIDIWADDYNLYDNGEIKRKFVYTK